MFSHIIGLSVLIAFCFLSGNNTGNGDLVQSVKYHLCKHEDLCLDFRTPLLFGTTQDNWVRQGLENSCKFYFCLTCPEQSKASLAW